ncbi:hypothetical protein [Streptomyces cellulosae]|uniref:Uncharacterized protein n=1 Tax=Streptomyces cellulosae TaxID=1968 RepID=A0ABW7YB42_STRCE
MPQSFGDTRCKLAVGRLLSAAGPVVSGWIDVYSGSAGIAG